MTYVTIGERIATARKSRGLTASQLARRVGVKVSTVNNWESDRSEPRANKLVSMAGVLGVSMMWLIEGNSDGTDLPPSVEVVETADLQSKIERLQSMHERMVQLLFEISSEVNRVQRGIREEQADGIG
ncbi:helix-turn-helix transcriptional regulator [Kiloniella laminariae]|uniref:Helix-turn-helix transcriptional regulator n=1 Tax=Kiloniella laminariae TaxID=454162 RepID=A0ABT4LG27_9PROT|nr:helix-turn-helix transcriptional regulator [Kiloniella laminariae]MCZ4280044.1 helix-turn-helix transcriptional regulator [Kiloniella laminariae]